MTQFRTSKLHDGSCLMLALAIATVVFILPISGQAIAGASGRQARLSLALVHAVVQGDDTQVYSLVKAGADVNIINPHGQPALVLAAENGDDNVVRFLLDRGALIDARGAKGSTALIRAAAQVHASTVAILLDRGADPKLRDTGSETALLRATLNPFAEAPISATVKALLSKGADVNEKDKEESPSIVLDERCEAELYRRIISLHKSGGLINEEIIEELY